MRDTDDFDAVSELFAAKSISIGRAFVCSSHLQRIFASIRGVQGYASTASCAATGSAAYFRQVYGANFLWILISVTIQADQARFGELIVQES